MIKSDLHTHSIASGHVTTDTIAQMAKQAARMNMSLLGITDHGPATLGSCKSSYFRSLAYAPKERFGVPVFYGVELNILDQNGSVDLDSHILSGLDYAVASMHTQNIPSGTIEENTAGYLNAMKNPAVKIIGHCDDTKYPVDYQALVAAAKEYHVLLEINNASLSPLGYRGDTRSNNETLLNYCLAYAHPVILSSDSHGCSHLGDVSYAEALIEKVGFPESLILNNQIEKLKDFIQR
ncbi:MAG: phosphatase [Lachnospiraceae bacterium]